MMRVGVILITAVLITTALVAGAAPRGQTPALTSYVLTISSSTGGNVTSPGAGNFAYYEGTVIYLIATPHAGYHFVDWTGNVSTINNVNRAATSIAINGSYFIMANFEEHGESHSPRRSEVSDPSFPVVLRYARRRVAVAVGREINHRWEGRQGAMFIVRVKAQEFAPHFT